MELRVLLLLSTVAAAAVPFEGAKEVAEGVFVKHGNVEDLEKEHPERFQQLRNGLKAKDSRRTASNAGASPLNGAQELVEEISVKHGSHIKDLVKTHPAHYEHARKTLLGQTPSKLVQASGVNYVFAFPNSHIYDDEGYTQNLTLTFTNTKTDQDAFIQVTSVYANFTAFNLTVPAGQSRLYYITPVDIQVNYLDILYNSIFRESKGIFISSTVPIEVVASNTHDDGYSGESYELIPTCQLGTEYRTVSDESARLGIYSTNLIIAVAVEDNTTVQMDYLGLYPLQRGQVIGIILGGPLTNWEIYSDKPVAVLSGAVCGYGYWQPTICDHEVVMQAPVTTWGTDFPVAAFPPEEFFEIMILSKDNGTEVYRDGVYFNYNLSSISYLLVMDRTGSRYYTTSKPAYTVQVGNMNSAGNGAPFFAHVPSPNQFTSEAVQFTPGHIAAGNHSWVSHYVRITTTLDNTNKILLDGYGVNPLFYSRMGRSNYYYADSPINFGTHVVAPVGNNVTFAVAVYGYGLYIGYAFTPGLDYPATSPCSS